MNPHDEQNITARDEGRKARAAKRASAAAFLPANDRFKQSYSALTYLGLILATALHFAVFEFFPQLEAADLGTVSEELSAIELPPEVKIPPPPEQIARPATPRVAAAAVDEDVTIAMTTLDSEGPRAAMSRIARIRPGNTMRPSTSRLIRASRTG